MKKTKNINRSQTVIRTKHVFTENEQVFVRHETSEVFLDNSTVAEWFPTNFKWIPVLR